MTSWAAWKRVWWPVALVGASVSLLGLECQLEPLPDQRRGYLGDLCRADNECEHRTSGDGGGIDLICAPDPAGPNRCRQRCTLGDERLCGTCGAEARCAAIQADDGGTLGSTGACIPARAEGEACSDGACAGCLLCARETANTTATCRRPCDINAPTTLPLPDDPAVCAYPALAEKGERALNNCCLYGQHCTVVSAGGTDSNACFGPLPGNPGGTCKPNRVCDGNAICVVGNVAMNIPDVCQAAGGENQPCRENSTCGANLTCICGESGGCRDNNNPAKPPALCRANCVTNDCGTCDLGFHCASVSGAGNNRGVCVPAPLEGESCQGGQLCSRCLACAGIITADGGQGYECRRTCLTTVAQTDADGGPIIGSDPRCEEPDPVDSGVLIQKNCCPVGDRCLPFILGDGGASNTGGCYE